MMDGLKRTWRRTWRSELRSALWERGESWEDVEHMVGERLDEEWWGEPPGDWAPMETHVAPTVWTRSRVYFGRETTYGHGVDSVPRHPTDDEDNRM